MFKKTAVILLALVVIVVPAVVIICGECQTRLDVAQATADAIERTGILPANLWESDSVESYKVGEDFRMIGDSRFPERIEASGGFVKTHAAIESQAGRSGWRVIRDYGGALVCSGWVPVRHKGQVISIISEKDLSETLEQVGITYAAAVLLVIVALKVRRNDVHQDSGGTGDDAGYITDPDGA